MKALLRFCAVLCATAVLTMACSTTRRVQAHSSDAYLLNTAGPARLVVQINNVTDEAKSRNNQVELVLNGKKLKPSQVAQGQRGEYLYELTLPSGVHKIQGKYRAKSFWKDKEFQLATHDGRVRLYAGYTTFLTMTLEKKSDGSLLRDKVFFTEAPRLQHSNAAPQVAPIAPERKTIAAPRAVSVASQTEERTSENSNVMAAQPIVIAPVPAQNVVAPSVNVEAANQVAPPATSGEYTAPSVSLDRSAVAPAPVAPPILNIAPVPPPATSAAFAPAPATSATPAQMHQVENANYTALGKIALQINTTPANADVIVDDKYLGQSPLITHVERGRSHVIQISKKGYADKMKLLDLSELAQQPTYFLMEKLEKEE